MPLRHASECRMDNPTNDNAAVQVIENFFLQSNFRKALAKANKWLKYVPVARPRSNDDSVILRARTPLYFAGTCEWETPRYVHVRLGSDGGDEAVDRVAAVAIQSFYEVWKAQRLATTVSTGQRQARKHLSPSVDIYCSQSKSHVVRCMGLSLAMILVELFCATGDFHGSTEFAGEVLHSLVTNGSCGRRNTLAKVLFMRLLPHASQTSQVEDFFLRLDRPLWTCNGTSWRASYEVHTESITFLLSVIANKANQSWGISTGTVEHCQNYLHRTISRVNYEKRPSSQRMMTQTEYRRPNPHCKPHTICLQRVLELCSWIRRETSRVLTNRNPIEQTSLAVTVLIILIAWRRKLALATVSKRAISLIVKPIQEIVQALLPGQS